MSGHDVPKREVTMGRNTHLLLSRVTAYAIFGITVRQANRSLASLNAPNLAESGSLNLSRTACWASLSAPPHPCNNQHPTASTAQRLLTIYQSSSVIYVFEAKKKTLEFLRRPLGDFTQYAMYLAAAGGFGTSSHSTEGLNRVESNWSSDNDPVTNSSSVAPIRPPSVY